MKTFLSNTLAKKFKSLGFAGALRFKILYWTYRLWPGLHIRHKEWDWVLEYFPPLHDKNQNVSVLDVGSTSSLFIYELKRRGYAVVGLDIRPYQELFTPFIRADIRKLGAVNLPTVLHGQKKFDFVTCISVLEHIGDGDWNEQRKAMDNMLSFLKPGGRLLLTIPTHEFAQTHPWHGFSKSDLTLKILPISASITEITERAGQICCCIQ